MEDLDKVTSTKCVRDILHVPFQTLKRNNVYIHIYKRTRTRIYIPLLFIYICISILYLIIENIMMTETPNPLSIF